MNYNTTKTPSTIDWKHTSQESTIETRSCSSESTNIFRDPCIPLSTLVAEHILTLSWLALYCWLVSWQDTSMQDWDTMKYWDECSMHAMPTSCLALTIWHLYTRQSGKQSSKGWLSLSYSMRHGMQRHSSLRIEERIIVCMRRSWRKKQGRAETRSHWWCWTWTSNCNNGNEFETILLWLL